MKINSGQAPSTLVPKYIGSDFDQVVTVSKNIEDVKTVAGAVEEVGVVVDNLGSVTTVGSNIGDVVNVSENMGYVQDVAAGIAGLPVISYIGEEPPTQPAVGSSWYCTTDGRTYVWYKGIDSYQWVESSPQSAPLDLQDVMEVAIANTDRQMKLLGYDLVKGSFEEGALLSKSTDVVLYKHTGVVYKWKGVFPAQIAANSSPTGTGIINWEEVVVPAMEASKYNYTLGASPDAELTGISGPTKESIVQTVGHITTCSFKLAGILTGTGPIEIALARQAITVTSISLIQCGVASTTAIFGRIKLGSGGMAISLYKDPTMLTPLQASDLHTGVFTGVVIGISFIQ